VGILFLSHNIMPRERLSQFSKGEKVKILGVHCGKDFSRRLSDLGLFDGAKVEIIKNDHFGPVIIKILNSKLALGRGEANKIYVEKI
jgi:ferrous iron transport protein A